MQGTISWCPADNILKKDYSGFLPALFFCGMAAFMPALILQRKEAL